MNMPRLEDQEILSNERDSPHESTNDPSGSNWHRWIGPIFRSRFGYAVRLAGPSYVCGPVGHRGRGKKKGVPLANYGISFKEESYQRFSSSTKEKTPKIQSTHTYLVKVSVF